MKPSKKPKRRKKNKMYNEHQTYCNGDMSFMEILLPEKVKVQHMDSYNLNEKRRFQGAFYYQFGDMQVICNDAPLEILKIAKSYKTHICNCKKEPHITWTIWFD